MNMFRQRIDRPKTIEDMFNVIDNNVPLYVSSCIFYNKEIKELVSTANDVSVYYDVYHSVLEIKWK